jgi:carboxypeptidase Q
LVNTYFAPIYNITTVLDGEGESVDSGRIGEYGVPMIRNIVDDSSNNDFYFTYHHSAGDSMTMMDPDALDKNAVAIAAMMFLIADME